MWFHINDRVYHSFHLWCCMMVHLTALQLSFFVFVVLAVSLKIKKQHLSYMFENKFKTNGSIIYKTK